jgi:hypothetical protein
MADGPWHPRALNSINGEEIALLLGEKALQQTAVSWNPCHRIIASEYAGVNLFDRIADASELDDLKEIADLTNPYVQSQAGQIELVKPEDRVYGLGSGLIMAAFAWPGRPSRFSDGSRGTYYAADSEETAIAETQYHDSIFLAGSPPTVVEKTLLHAVLDATLVDIRPGCPSPAGVYDPHRYEAGQALGKLVRLLDGHGIIYDSVRRPKAECVAIFRPTALRNAQPSRTLECQWDGNRLRVT